MKKSGLYIHIPFCKKKCNYCDFFSVKQSRFSSLLQPDPGDILKIDSGSVVGITDKTIASPFARRLIADMYYMKSKYNIALWDTVFVGGGTPSLLSGNDMEFIFSSIVKSQKIPPQEFTIEVNPEDLTEKMLETIYASGVNRVSLGIQSFSDEVLFKANRRGCSAQNKKALQLLKKINTGTISCDLIAGLEGQTQETIKTDIETLLEFTPENISFYALCSNKKLSEAEEDRIADLWLFGKTLLQKNGYKLYEVSNFSYQGKYKSLHNQKYWKLEDYIGIGPGACGCVFFPQEKAIKNACATRFFASKNIKKWIETQERNLIYEYENISQKELIKEKIMMGFRLTQGINIESFKTRFGKDLCLIIKNTITKWQNLKALLVNTKYIKLNKKGFLFLNLILQDVFDELE